MLVTSIRDMFSEFIDSYKSPVLVTPNASEYSNGINYLTLSAMAKEGYGIQAHIGYRNEIHDLILDLVVDTCPKFSAKALSKVTEMTENQEDYLPAEYSTVRRIRLAQVPRSRFYYSFSTEFRNTFNIQFDTEKKDFNLVEFPLQEDVYFFTRDSAGLTATLRTNIDNFAFTTVTPEDTDFLIVLNAKIEADRINQYYRTFPFCLDEGQNRFSSTKIITPAVRIQNSEAGLYRVVPSTNITLDHLTKGIN